MSATEHQRDLLMTSIVEAARKAGIATHEHVSFDGPTCLMLVDDMATYILRLEESLKLATEIITEVHNGNADGRAIREYVHDHTQLTAIKDKR